MNELARKIPERVRSEILLGADDPINNVVDSPANKHMQTLFAIYYEYLYPFASNKDLHCWRCRGRVLHFFRGIYGDLLVLEKESQLLKLLRP